MVSLSVKLLTTYKINMSNYEIVLQCFETITEFIQGPCKKNQILIANGNFLRYAINILDVSDFHDLSCCFFDLFFVGKP